MPLGSFWFYLVYDRLPKNAEEMQGILGMVSSMSSVAPAPQPPSRPDALPQALIQLSGCIVADFPWVPGLQQC